MPLIIILILKVEFIHGLGRLITIDTIGSHFQECECQELIFALKRERNDLKKIKSAENGRSLA